eukprot:1825337-Rhodomonas_salina.2
MALSFCAGPTRALRGPYAMFGTDFAYGARCLYARYATSGPELAYGTGLASGAVLSSRMAVWRSLPSDPQYTGIALSLIHISEPTRPRLI